MTNSDYQLLQAFNKTLHQCNADPNCNLTELKYHNVTVLDYLSLPGDGSPLLRACVSVVHVIVCALGLASNLMVLYLLRPSRTKYKTTINYFVFNLAITDLLFSMVQPFWTIDTALDYNWPFGLGMCKAVSFLTALNVYAGAFFLTAMSVARYCSVVHAFRSASCPVKKSCLLRVTAYLIWSTALLAAIPSVVFSTVADMGEDQLCLLRFPEGTFWLGVHHLLRVSLGFLLPYIILIVCYLLLLHFLSNHNKRGISHHCHNKVSKPVVVIVASFCLCWLPINIITFWGILIKFDFLEWTSSFYVIHTYVFPLATCLAYTNSCLNPVMYCLARREFRVEVRRLLWRSCLSGLYKACLTALSYSKVEAKEDHLSVPFKCKESQNIHLHVKMSTSFTPVPSPLTGTRQ